MNSLYFIGYVLSVGLLYRQTALIIERHTKGKWVAIVVTLVIIQLVSMGATALRKTF